MDISIYKICGTYLNMNICVISSGLLTAGPFGYKGTERIAWELADWLGSKGHSVTLVAPKGSVKGNFELVETISEGFNIPDLGFDRDRLHIQEAIKLLASKSFDLVINHQGAFYIENVWIGAKEYHWWVHGWLPPYPHIHKVKIYARSKAHAELLKQKFEGWEVRYCYNWIDPEKYPFTREKEDYFLFFSRIAREKGVHNFIRLAKQFPEEKFVIAGMDDIAKGTDPYYLVYILKECCNLPNVEYRGSVSESEKIELLKKAKALIVPLDMPYFEVFGLWVLESLCCGCPVITQAGFGGPDEIITPNCGYLAKNMNDMAEFLKSFLKGEIEFKPEDCRKRAEDFNKDKILEGYLEEVYTLST